MAYYYEDSQLSGLKSLFKKIKKSKSFWRGFRSIRNVAAQVGAQAMGFPAEALPSGLLAPVLTPEGAYAMPVAEQMTQALAIPTAGAAGAAVGARAGEIQIPGVGGVPATYIYAIVAAILIMVMMKK